MILELGSFSLTQLNILSYQQESMFSASKAFFQRVARTAMHQGAPKMTLATAAPKSYNPSAICAVGNEYNLIYYLGCWRSCISFFRWLPDF